jgi:hypothetical protein
MDGSNGSLRPEQQSYREQVVEMHLEVKRPSQKKKWLDLAMPYDLYQRDY